MYFLLNRPWPISVNVYDSEYVIEKYYVFVSLFCTGLNVVFAGLGNNFAVCLTHIDKYKR